jgi:hypothetical protein
MIAKLFKYFKSNKRYSILVNKHADKYSKTIADQGMLITHLEAENTNLMQELANLKKQLKTAQAEKEVAEFISASAYRTIEHAKNHVNTMIDQQKAYTLKLEERLFVLEAQDDEKHGS